MTKKFLRTLKKCGFDRVRLKGKGRRKETCRQQMQTITRCLSRLRRERAREVLSLG